MKTNKKNVLLLNASKKDNFGVTRLHMGLSLLGGILKRNGHDVKLYDLSYYKSLDPGLKIPAIAEILNEFKPDVVCISVFTYLYDECVKMIEEVSSAADIPIILGGPHFTIFPQEFAQDSRISYILRGEAEKVILSVVENVKKEPKPVLIECPLPEAADIPLIDLDIAFGAERLVDYQIQLSRGCPYSCTFCNIEMMAGRRVRARDIDMCLEQIVNAKKRYPSIQQIIITDDCPTYDKNRFKTFLRKFAAKNLGCSIWIDNVRGNLIDDELLELYAAAGGKNICLGTESGHPEVFRLVNKGETLEEIVYAAELIKKHGLILGLCFVIGLPEDTPARHKYSVTLAKTLKPEYIFWNMCVPWPGTNIHAWFEKNGRIGDLRNFSTLIDHRMNFKDPVAESRAFTKYQRIRAWLSANMETHRYFQDPRDFRKMLYLTVRYNLYGSFLPYYRMCIAPHVKQYISLTKQKSISNLKKTVKFFLRLVGLFPKKNVLEVKIK